MPRYAFLLWQDESKAERPGTPGSPTPPSGIRSVPGHGGRPRAASTLCLGCGLRLFEAATFGEEPGA